MKKKIVYLTACIDTGATQFACRYLRKFDLKQISEIHITPAEHDHVEITFYFATSPNMFEQITVKHAFSVGYRGEGPWGLHDLMIDAGFSETKASSVFEASIYAETIIVK